MDNINKEYNYSIAIYRIIATIFILVCHLGNALNIGFIAQSFNVGVQFFLLISGFLYGERRIKDANTWLLKRYGRVTIPIIVYVIICLLVSIIDGNTFSWLSLPLYILNLQGYYHLIEFLPQIQLIEGTSHLWFITVLFICYLLVYLINVFNLHLRENNLLLFLAFGLPIVILCSLFGIRLDYIYVFFIGYAIKKCKIKSDMKSIIVSLLFTIIFVSIRLMLKVYCDRNGDIPLYTNVASPISYICISIFSFFLVDLVVNLMIPSALSNNKERVLKLFDSLTFYIYLGHYILVSKGTNIFEINISIVLQIVIYLLGSLIIGAALYMIHNLLIKAKDKIGDMYGKKYQK